MGVQLFKIARNHRGWIYDIISTISLGIGIGLSCQLHTKVIIPPTCRASRTLEDTCTEIAAVGRLSDIAMLVRPQQEGGFVARGCQRRYIGMILKGIGARSRIVDSQRPPIPLLCKQTASPYTQP